MPGDRRGQTSAGEKVAAGLLAGHDKALDMVSDRMLHAAPKATRFVAKRIPGAPGLVYDVVQIAAAKPEDRMRQTFGAIGGALGSAGGGGLGMLTGPAAPVAAPLGAAVGGALGEDIGTDIYDRNKAVIDDGVDAARRRLEDTARWMKARTAQVRDGLMHDLQNYAPIDYLPGRPYGR
jgi:hypothetical protein